MTANNNVSSDSITRLSPAKINLFLHITGKRTDGYHNLQTVFRLLNWGDYLHFLPTKASKLADLMNQNISLQQQADNLCAELITLTGASSITDNLADNLIIKAAHMLLIEALKTKSLPNQLSKVTITLDKHLPMGAGLGGGSSNAATTLLVLNELWQLNFNCERLLIIAASLGADVPIFIFGQDAIAMGIGEQLSAINLPDQHYLLLTPKAHINTAKLFAHPRLQRNVAKLPITTIREQAAQYTQTLTTPYQNVFTSVVTNLAPAVAEALHYLKRLEPQAQGVARMTGSGSAVFLPLDDSIVNDTSLLAKWVARAPCSAYIVESLKP